MENTESRLYFASDYMEGAHPAIMKKLMETNLEKTVGYGQDPYTEDAKEKIRKACNAPEPFRSQVSQARCQEGLQDGR